ncbi:Chorion peroxidase [Zootermopsis nevadensis]|uniref:Chorion peroxidase n=2 Tax=Zootermopsis nevadensis TaxID=136037 RepID=A0A067QMX8_ZOONE|nr:Chorion peroxidase [Zootermopsis nevadensis]
MSEETQRKLKRIYRDVDDIDLFPGAMAERPVSGGLVGSTFACILAQQFSNLRKGDRFWYENGGFESSFTLAQLQQIRRVTLARMLCDNLDGIDTLQPFVFLTADNDRNYRVPCDSEYILHLDLKPWTEHRKQEQYHHEKPTDHQHLSSHHTPSYPSYQKPTPSYHHTTTPSYEEHQPSYLIDIELQPPPKPHEENKPTYLIDTNFQGKPTKPQNLYTSSMHPKPDEHKPTYLIDESFQQTERPTSKRPSGYKPSNSAHLAMEHKQPDYNNHNQGHDHGAELPSKLETRPPGDYHHHHQEEYSQSETEPTGGHNHLSIFEHYGGHNPHKPHKEYPSNHYEPVHHKPHYEQQTTDKPHSEYPHHKPHDEYPSYSKPHYEHTTHSKPYDEYPSYSKPHYEHTTHSKPYDEYPSYSKPHYEHTTHSKPYDEYPSYSKPHYEHTTQSTPHYEFPNSKPHYGHTSQSKPYNEHTSHYKPQYVYTFNIPHTTISSKPHYEHTSFTKPSDNKDIPSTLDYNKYKPHPSKPSSHQDGSYSVVTRPPYKEQHYSGTYSSAGRPSYEKPSSGYHHTSYSYIEVFNEPTYYYLEDSKVVGNAHRSPEKATLDPGLLDFKSSMMQTNSSSMEQEPRTSLGDSDIVPPDDVNSYAGLTTFTGDTTSENNETVNFVTIKGNIVSINATPDEKRKIMVFSSRINITEDANVNNNVPNTSILHSEKQVTTMENINAIVTENITKSDNTTTIMNARNTTELNNTEFGNTMDNITNSSKINITNLENNNNFIITAIAKQNKTDSTKTTNNSTNSSIGIEHSITENNIHLDNININLGTQPNNTRNNNTANENVESITEQTKTAYDSTIFHIDKIDTNVTNVNNIINTNTDIQMNTGEQTTTVTKITQQDMNINTNTETSQETVLKTDMTIHELTPNTTYAESYTAYAIITENENEWIFTKEEDDGSFIIPEMPSITSDPMALKELPRPMKFENEETGRGLV